MQTLSVSADTTRKSNKALWEKGDCNEIAAMMRQPGADLVRSLPIATPLRALDPGCGDGTTAVPLAILGAGVLGIDIAENLVRAGAERAARLGLARLTFQEGDACNLRGIADESFELVISVFGAMLAPKPFDVAREMVRVAWPRRSPSDKQLDPGRPNVVRVATVEDQFLVLAGAAWVVVARYLLGSSRSSG